MQLPYIQSEPISIQEFLPILMASEIKLELIEGEIGAFANGTVAHGLVCNRIIRALRNAAEPGCEVFGSDIAVQRMDAPTYVFPDATYTREYVAVDADSIVAPSLIVEVMSPDSVKRDRVDKLDSYQAIPSVDEYLIVDSPQLLARVYRRQGKLWTYTVYGPLDTVELFSICTPPRTTSIKLADLYSELSQPCSSSLS